METHSHAEDVRHVQTGAGQMKADTRHAPFLSLLSLFNER